MTYISRPHHTTNLLHRVQIRAKATMHGEDLLVNDCCDWQAIEAVGKGLPQLDVVPSLALIVEAIDTVDGGTLMISS